MSKTLKVVAAAVLLIVVAVGCTKLEEPDHKGDNSGYSATVVPYHGGADNDSIIHGFVDLGLPNGTLWATCNVGADSPEEIGDCFSWGETRPKRF